MPETPEQRQHRLRWAPGDEDSHNRELRRERERRALPENRAKRKAIRDAYDARMRAQRALELEQHNARLQQQHNARLHNPSE
jgi:hypothetical protein